MYERLNQIWVENGENWVLSLKPVFAGGLLQHRFWYLALQLDETCRTLMVQSFPFQEAFSREGDPWILPISCLRARYQ